MIFKGKNHVTADAHGNTVVQNEKREAIAIVVDGKARPIRRAKNDKL